MKLPFFGSFGKKEEKNYFLALLLQDEKIGAVILEEVAGRIHVVSSAEEHFSTSLEKASFEEWLNSIDKAVSLAENNVEGDIQTEKTVFGVKQDWVIDGKIKKDYLLKLKKVCDELALTPIGFLVFTEAIIHLLQKEEGAPVSAILVEVGKKSLSISLIRAGRIVQTQLATIEGKITEDVDKALKNFDTEILPARIILYDSENNEKLSQSFISHAWSKSLPFLHMPQITVLAPNFDTKGVLYGTASQMGLEVFGEHAIPNKTVGAKNSSDAKAMEDLKESPEKEAKLEPEEKETFSEEKEASSAESYEEPKEEDVTLLEKIEVEEEKDEEKVEKIDKIEKLETVDSEFFGFVENKDVSKVSHKDLPKYKKGGMSEDVFEEIPEEVKEEETGFGKPTGEIGTQSALLFEGLKKGFNSAMKSSPKIMTSISGFVTNFFKKGKNKDDSPGEKSSAPVKLIAIIIALVVTLVAVFLIYIFTISAQVNIAITPKVIDETTKVTLAVDGESNFDSGQIAAKTISQNESANQSQDTTGTKKVGTNAKGQITIFSRLTSNTNLKKGATITCTTPASCSNLQFTLDGDVSIASFSGDTSDPSVTVANIPVTAKDFGPEYNLPSGTKFSINGLDKTDISAKNDNPFTNGTKKDINIVSKDDVDKLLIAITKDQEGKATEDMKKTLSDQQILLEFFSKEDVVKKTLSKNIGDEAKSVSVDATISYEGIVVDKNELTEFAKQALKDQLTKDSDLVSSELKTELTDTKQDKNKISGNLAIKMSLLPKIDKEQISKDISGKSFDAATNIIKNISQISDVQIKLSPNLPLLPKTLPRIGSHIHINVLTDE